MIIKYFMEEDEFPQLKGKQLNIFLDIALLIKLKNISRTIADFERAINIKVGDICSRVVINELIKHGGLVFKEKDYSYKKYILDKKAFKRILSMQILTTKFERAIDVYGLW